MRQSVLFSLLLSLGVGAAVGRGQTVVFGFENGTDGWTVVDYASSNYDGTPSTTSAIAYQENWGDPGGFVHATDPSSGSFYFNAPTASLGDFSAFIGGTLSYSRYTTPATPAWRGDADVILSGAGLVLVSLGETNPGTTWDSLSFNLTASAWHLDTLSGAAPTAQQFASVLSSLSVLRIRGEYVDGVVETSGLDSVTFQAVPEPGTWAMMAAGLGVLGLVAWRRRS